MNRFTKFVLNHKALILGIFAVILIASVICVGFVKKNSDVQTYLPDDAESSMGKEELAETFGIHGEFSIAVKNADKTYLDSFTAGLEDNEHVTQVAWMGRFDALKDAIDRAPAYQKPFLKQSYEKIREKFLKSTDDGADVYVISVYLNIPNTEDAVMKMIDEIRVTLDQAVKDGRASEYFMGGGAINAKNLLESSIGDIPKFLIIAVIIIAVILLFTTKSWLEPLIFLMTLGISILINMGTNLVLGEVSTITYSASTILQLALAMDYSIFLMHAYYEERKRDPIADAKTALSRALPKTLKSVAASALTTIGGFIALFMMEFGIGMDLGAVLAKGVLLSLLTVVILQPIMILLLQKPIDKTKHKYFTPKLKRTQRFACKYYLPLVIVALVLVVPSFIMQFNVSLSYLSMEKETKNPTQTQIVVQESSNQLIVMVPDNREKDSKDYVKHYEFIRALGKMQSVGNIFSAYSIVPEIVYTGGIEISPDLKDQLESTFFKGGYVLYTLELKTDTESEQTYAAIDQIRSLANEKFGTQGNPTRITGLAMGAKDLAAMTPNDFLKVSLISAVIIFVILVLTYRSFSLSAILLFVIELGIWINLSIVALIGTKINFMSYLIISAVQLGATVDYAILVASKFKQAQKDGEKDPIEAIRKGVSLASPSVLVSATILIGVCIGVYAVSSNVIIGEITMLIAAGALMSTILVMTLLPAILTMQAKIKHCFDEKRLAKAGVPEAIARDAEPIEADRPKEPREKKPREKKSSKRK